MKYFTWIYNNVEYREVDPMDPVPVADENQGKPLYEALGMTLNEAQQVSTDYAWNKIRNQRDVLIAETDWVSGDDVPQSLKDKFYTYRQALRDITTQTDPQNIVWPEKPE